MEDTSNLHSTVKMNRTEPMGADQISDSPFCFFIYSPAGGSHPHLETKPTPMAASLKLLFAALLLHIFAPVESQRCDLSSLRVQQTNTGKKVGYDPVFEVEVKNLCRCAVANVFLRSEGFASSMIVDPKLFRREGVGYVVNDGKGIPSLLSIKFRYAWDRAFKMSPASLQVNCR